MFGTMSKMDSGNLLTTEIIRSGWDSVSTTAARNYLRTSSSLLYSRGMEAYKIDLHSESGKRGSFSPKYFKPIGLTFFGTVEKTLYNIRTNVLTCNHA